MGGGARRWARTKSVASACEMNPSPSASAARNMAEFGSFGSAIWRIGSRVLAKASRLAPSS